MASKGIYPAPAKPRWLVMVELLDGTPIAQAVTDEGALEQWGRSLGWMVGRWLTPAEVVERVSHFARGFYGATLPEGVECLPAQEFLNALDDAGVVKVIRR